MILTRPQSCRCLGACVFSVIFFSLLGALPLTASEPSSRTLDSGWQFRAVGNTDHADVKQWHPAQVPGVVHTDLLRNSLIPDPFDRDNEFHLQWIGLTDWEYQTTFQVDAGALGHDHVDLVFEGLDTFADVYLNDQAILQADNMFRSWRIPAKALLKPGQNTLRIVFHSAVTKMIPYVKSLPYILPAISTNNSGTRRTSQPPRIHAKRPINTAGIGDRGSLQKVSGSPSVWRPGMRCALVIFTSTNRKLLPIWPASRRNSISKRARLPQLLSTWLTMNCLERKLPTEPRPCSSTPA